MRLNEQLEEFAVENGWEIVEREVMPDHVHIVVGVRQTVLPSEEIHRFKGCTSRTL